jgi:Rrf2 family transcriptional regulator, iron-sulfur cluster assembly transcription factor
VIFSTPVAYAIRGLAELAARAGTGSLMLEQLTTGTDLPRGFLAKLFQKLVKARILTSVKGRRGGFALARAPHTISLMQIMAAMGEEEAATRCVLGMPQCNEQTPCPQHDLYKPIRQRLNDYLQTTTLADVAASLKSKPAWHRIRGPQDQVPDAKEHA